MEASAPSSLDAQRKPVSAACASAPTRPTVVHVMTVPASLYFLSGQIAFLRGRGFDVHAVSSPGPELQAFGEQERIPVHPVPMTRRISPVDDLRSLYRMWRVIRAVQPEIVHAHTPKAGLLGMLAAWLARTPVRVYHVRGLPFVTASGWRRAILLTTERASCRIAHRVLAVSHSMRRIAVAEGLCDAGKVVVLAGGSGQGVDASGRFRPLDVSVRLETRARFAIPADALVVGFVGRVVREKGVVELARAWALLREEDPRLHLLLVGRVDTEGALPPHVLATLRSDARVHFAGVVNDTAPVYAAMDVVALPTYREGFPNVALETAAMALPIVATEIPGCVDAVADGETGLLIPVRDPARLASALRRYLFDPELRARHGAAGRRRVLASFRREDIWDALGKEYLALTGSTASPLPAGARPRRRSEASRGSAREGGEP